MSNVRVYPHFDARVETIRDVLTRHESFEPEKLRRILEELHALDEAISTALKDPKSYDPTGLKKLQSEVHLLEGRVQIRQIHADLYRLTDSAIDLWLKRPVSAEERKERIRELKARMQDLTSNHRFTREDQRFITLFHACVQGVEKGVLPSHIDKIDLPTKSPKARGKTAAQIISIEEVKKRALKDPLEFAELLYAMAALIYKGDYTQFFDAYNALSTEHKEQINDHVVICGGNMSKLQAPRDKHQELLVAQGILGYANDLMENTDAGDIYPSFLSIHQMMLELSELEKPPL